VRNLRAERLAHAEILSGGSAAAIVGELPPGEINGGGTTLGVNQPALRDRVPRGRRQGDLITKVRGRNGVTVSERLKARGAFNGLVVMKTARAESPEGSIGGEVETGPSAVRGNRTAVAHGRERAHALSAQASPTVICTSRLRALRLMGILALPAPTGGNAPVVAREALGDNPVRPADLRKGGKGAVQVLPGVRG
jgi:hypothetical protein